jgi:hypothetical protein
MLDSDNIGQTRSRRWHTNGVMLYDGRGRYIEPNYRIGRARPALRQFHRDDPGPRCHCDADAAQRLFLDSALRRIPSDGTPAGDSAARARARYHLRYALGVIDSVVTCCRIQRPISTRLARPGERVPPAPWLQEAAEAWYSMTAFVPTSVNRPGNKVTHALRGQNSFLGRGNASSFDRAAAGGFPVTFPMMFRINQNQTPVHTAAPLNYKKSYWGPYGSSAAAAWSERDHRLLNMLGVTATPAGGELLRHYYWDTTSAIVGPQPSWFTSTSQCAARWAPAARARRRASTAAVRAEQARSSRRRCSCPPPSGAVCAPDRRPDRGAGTRAAATRRGWSTC